MIRSIRVMWLAFALAMALVFPGAANAGEVYVFGPGLVIDTTRGIAWYGPFQSDIQDCSTDQVLCLNTNFIQVAAPRGCAPLRPGDALPGHRTTFEVIGEVFETGRAGPRSLRLTLVADRSRPNSILGYAPTQGIRMIVRHEGRSPRNLLSELNEAQDRGRLQQAFDALERNKLPLTTFAPLFPCEPASPQPSATAERNGETYVFGNLVLDTRRGLARHGASEGALRNCSTDHIHCLRTDFIQIAVPRACRHFRPGDTIPGEGTRFEVIGGVFVSSYRGINPEPAFLLGDPARRDTVVGYEPRRGVRFILRGDAEHQDLLALLTDAQARGRLFQEYRRLARYRLEMSTFAPLFRCGSSR